MPDAIETTGVDDVGGANEAGWAGIALTAADMSQARPAAPSSPQTMAQATNQAANQTMAQTMAQAAGHAPPPTPAPAFAQSEAQQVLSATEALCPQCLRRLPALRVRRGREVWLVRQCPEHGEAGAVIWRGGPEFESWRRPKIPSAPPVLHTPVDRGCPFDCGLCPEHGQHTCTAVVEVTSRCDLRCPVCYASSGGACGPDPTPAQLAARLADLRRTAGACNLQLSGGEPTSRHDLPEIIAAARAQHFGLVQLNTNGLRLAREPGYAERLADAGLQSVFLQFDGPDEACMVLRGQPLFAAKLAALDACASAGLGVVLVPTLLAGVNEHALGDILRLGMARAPTVRGVHFQPASTFGRFPGAQNTARRLTLPEVLTLLVAQSGGMLRAEDFHPPGCEHERCSFSGSFALDAGRLLPLAGGGCCAGPAPLAPDLTGRAALHSNNAARHDANGSAAPGPFRSERGCESGSGPLTKMGGTAPGEPLPADVSAPIHAPIRADEGARQAKAAVARQWAAAPVSAKAEPNSSANSSPPRDDFERFLAQRGADKRFSISCMAFQDAWTLDLERVRGCCIHTQAEDGRLVPFCLYNLTATDGHTLYRERRP